MRIALVSVTERTSDGEMRAEQLLAGRSVLEWQIDLALQMGCERVICLCQAPSSGFIIAEQRKVEGQGLTFHSVRSHLQMASLVRAEDQLFIQLDGLIVGDEALEAAFNEGLQPQAEMPNVILTLGADHTLSSANPDDFERIDRDRHWGGIAVLPGECAVALKEMPEDGDAVSLLLRLGLQARVPCENVPAALLGKGQWLLAVNSEAIEERGKGLIAASLPFTHWSGPGAFLARSVVRLSAPHWLGNGAEISACVSIAGMLGAAGLAAFGLGPVGLGVAAVSAFAASMAHVAGKLRAGLAGQSDPPVIIRWLRPVIAALAIGILILAGLGTSNLQVDLALPVIAIVLAYVTGQRAHPFSREFWRDTPAHLLLFATCAGFGVLQTALLVFSLGALLQLMLRANRN